MPAINATKFTSCLHNVEQYPWALQLTCAGELGRLLLDAYIADDCPVDPENFSRPSVLVNDFIAAMEQLSSDAAMQAASEGSKVVQAALKWVKSKVVPLSYSCLLYLYGPTYQI